jgi:hypothetical protein
MILIPFSVLMGLVSTFGFAHGINRKPDDHISLVEWLLSVGVGCFVAVAIYSLLH